ncbi:CMP-N-acetylneuraminate-beta-galactosamide-alpha-2,3-sialyltransferase 4 [Eucyclogobius newberryi]|uniref:CMP-N-acetylneuraminate-beta-galactosamide- alpha-2,3-sialyltransferase 4 n=1 Tax=Eucyclogobius newberryi TaxID=166745 RepID=UPI003B58E720
MRHDGTEELVKMSQKSAKTWCLRLFPVFLFCISFFTYYCSYTILQSYGGANKPLNSSKSLCGGWLTQKKWESLNFNTSRQSQLFLKLDDFFWRKHLSKLPLPYGIKGSEQMLTKVLAATESFQESKNVENLECKTCVVVGNSFSIKNTSLGSVINKYHVVFRLNDAPVREYEDDVGNKTSMRLFYPESASVNPTLHNDPGTLMVLVPFKLEDLRWLKEILYNEKRVRKGFWKLPPQIWLADPMKIRVLNPHFLHQTAERLLHIPLYSSQQPVHPTTGILAVVVALNYCDVVHIAGFGYPHSKNQKHPIHYYGSATMKSMKNSYHDLNHEAEALKRLEDAGAILYLHPHL